LKNARAPKPAQASPALLFDPRAETRRAERRGWRRLKAPARNARAWSAGRRVLSRPRLRAPRANASLARGAREAMFANIVPPAAFRRSTCGFFPGRATLSRNFASWRSLPVSRLPAGLAPGWSSAPLACAVDEGARENRTLLHQTTSPVDALAEQGGRNVGKAGKNVKE